MATDTNANLHDAINGEQHEADGMYPDYARQADQAGNSNAANLFREIAADEKTHQQTFQKALTERTACCQAVAVQMCRSSASPLVATATSDGQSMPGVG